MLLACMVHMMWCDACDGKIPAGKLCGHHRHTRQLATPYLTHLEIWFTPSICSLLALYLPQHTVFIVEFTHFGFASVFCYWVGTSLSHFVFLLSFSRPGVILDDKFRFERTVFMSRIVPPECLSSYCIPILTGHFSIHSVEASLCIVPRSISFLETLIILPLEKFNLISDPPLFLRKIFFRVDHPISLLSFNPPYINPLSIYVLPLNSTDLMACVILTDITYRLDL